MFLSMSACDSEIAFSVLLDVAHIVSSSLASSCYRALERQRTINSMSLSEERQILKDINIVRKIKAQVEEYHTVEKTIEDIRRQLSELREVHRETMVEADEAATALAQIKLANQLDCEVEQLTAKEIMCPQHRLGAVIGKNGSMMKHIEKLCLVHINVQQDDKITITGAKEALQQAVIEIEKIIRMQEEEISLEESVSNFLTARDVNVLNQWREEHPDVKMDAIRGSGKMTVLGDPKQLEILKAKIRRLYLQTEKRQLNGNEIGVVVGRKGNTIDLLCKKHELFIHVEKEGDDSATVTFTGPGERVNAVMNEVDTMINDNEDAVHSIAVGAVMRRILLAESGRHIKSIQAKVREGLSGAASRSCILSLNSDRNTKGRSEVIVKTKRSMIFNACELTQNELNQLELLVVTLNVDPAIVPKIIGKSGDTIRALAPGKTTFLEVVDRECGTISYGATTIEQRDELGKEIEVLLSNNSVLRIKADHATLKVQYRELSRSSIKPNLDEIAWLGLDEATSCFILRGKKEDLDKAKELVEDHIAKNCIATIPITLEDEDGLLTGGKSSKIVDFSKDLDVVLNIDRDNHLLLARGTKEKVETAKTTLNQYINGGNGHCVSRFPATAQVAGSIIGKGGKTRHELEVKHGVSINVSKAGVVTIRGPDHSVADCRFEIERLVASVRVSRSIEVTPEQKASLEKKDYNKMIRQQVPVHFSATVDKITIAGTSVDVRDAAAILNEMLKGTYETSVELDPQQFARVRGIARDPSHFQRIASSSDSHVLLDLGTGSISIFGKRANVKKAKEQMYDFLDFALPGELKRLKVSKPLQQSICHAAALAEVAALAGGLVIMLDRDLNTIVLRSPDAEKVKNAALLLEEKIAQAARLVFVLELSAPESWIIPSIIGKNGSNVAALRAKHPRCKIEISKEARTITVSSDTEEHLKEAQELIVRTVEQTRRETTFVLIPDNDIARFVGKGGSHVKELSAKHGVEIQKVRKVAFNFKISGDEKKIAAAKNAIDQWLDESANAKTEFSSTPTIDIKEHAATNGSTVRTVEDTTVRTSNDAKKHAALANPNLDIEIKKREAEVAMEPDQSNVENGVPASNNVATRPFPVYPVGVKPPANGKGRKKKTKKPASHADEGTQAGRNLFAMLVADD